MLEFQSPPAGICWTDVVVTSKASISRWRNCGVLILRGAHAIRDLRSGLLDLIYWLDAHPDHQGLLVLADTRLGEDSLEKELERSRCVIRSDLIDRIEVVILNDPDELAPLVERLNLPAGARHGLRDHIRKQLEKTRRRRIPQSAHDLVFETLVNRWLLGHGPMTTESLIEATGFSYPPVAKALNDLGSHINRHSDRRIELSGFPRQEWRRYLSQVERQKLSRKFAFPEGLSRSPESLLKRFGKVHAEGAAIGGVHAARHFCPDLDLVGAPRLDLSLHCPSGKLDLKWIRRLDAALEPVESDAQTPQLVVWPVFRIESMFQVDSKGLSFADPVSCLVALHDARLESQAGELVAAFEKTLLTSKTSEAH